MRKRMSFKRAAAWGTIFAMTAGLMSGCSAKKAAFESVEEKKIEETAQSSEAPSKTEGKSYTDYSKGFPEKVTIKIPGMTEASKAGIPQIIITPTGFKRNLG